MFERFTDRARKCMAYANQEASRWNHEYIGTEHLLLGLVKEGTGVGANVLKTLGVNLKDIENRIDATLEAVPGPIPNSKKDQTPRAKRVIEGAIRSSKYRGDNHLGTEHLLLGMLQNTDDAACIVLNQLIRESQGIHLNSLSIYSLVLETISNMVDPCEPGDAIKPEERTKPIKFYNKLTDRSRKVLALARQEAKSFSHRYVGTEHLLIGLLTEGNGIGATILMQSEISANAVRTQIKDLIYNNESDANPALSSQVKKVLEHANEECIKMNHSYIGTEHILLGLLKLRESIAVQCLANILRDKQLDAIEDATYNLLGFNVDAPAASPPEGAEDKGEAFLRFMDNLVSGLIKRKAGQEEVKEEFKKTSYSDLAPDKTYKVYWGKTQVVGCSFVSEEAGRYIFRTKDKKLVVVHGDCMVVGE